MSTKQILSVLDFLSRNGMVLILLFAVVYALGKSADVSVKTGLQVVFFEAIAIGLSGIAAFIFTSFQLRKEMRSNDESKILSAMLLSAIFLGVHVCVGLCVLGIHFISWAPTGG